METPNQKRALTQPSNLGEFAFATAVFGAIWLIAAVIFGALTVAGLPEPWYEAMSAWGIWSYTCILWILFQIPLYRRMLRHASAWPSVNSSSPQLLYFEWSGLGFTLILGLLVLIDPVSGWAEIVHDLKIVFAILTLFLVGYHAAACLFLRCRPKRHDVVVWAMTIATSVWTFR